MKTKTIAFLSFVFILFGNNSFSQKIIKHNNLLGLNDNSGKIVLKPEYDSIYDPTIQYKPKAENSYGAGFFILKQGNKKGYAITPNLQSNDWIFSQTDYDNVELIGFRNMHIYIRLKKENRYGFIALHYYNEDANSVFPSQPKISGVSNVCVFQPQFDTVFIDAGYLVFVNKIKGRPISHGGRHLFDDVITPPIYDIDYMGKERNQKYLATSIIKKNGLFGLIDNGKIIVEPNYDSIYNYSLADNYDKGWQGFGFYILVKDSNEGYAIRPEYNKIDDWIIVKPTFDSIRYMYRNTRPVPSAFSGIRNYLLIKDSKYGYIRFHYYKTGGSIAFSSMATIKGFTDYYISKPEYDTVYLDKDDRVIMSQNDKYGMHMYDSIIISPIYDAIEDIYEEYILVTKNDLQGVLKETKLIIPIAYKKGEINFFFEDGNYERFLITQKGKPIKIFNPFDSTFLTLHSNGKPLIQIDSVCNKENQYSQEFYFDNREFCIYSHITSFYDSCDTYQTIWYYPNLKSNKNGSKSHILNQFPFHIIIYSKKTGIAVEYNKPNCNYTYNDKVITEFEIDTKSEKNINVTFYSIFDKKVIYKYTDTSYCYKDGLVSMDGGEYYKIKINRLNSVKDGKERYLRLINENKDPSDYCSYGKERCKGYIDVKTLEYRRRIPFVLF